MNKILFSAIALVFATTAMAQLPKIPAAYSNLGYDTNGRLYFKDKDEKYFAEEVLPHVPDAWIDFDKTRIGYEINFTKYFYEYKGLRAAKEVKTEIVSLEREITTLLNELLN